MDLKLLLLVLGVGAFGYAWAYPNGYYYGNGYNPRKRSSSASIYNSLDRRYPRSKEVTTSTTATSNRSDKENAKFAGASNQELDDVGDERTLLLKKKLKRLYGAYGGYGGYGGYAGYGGGFGSGYGINPCRPFGRDAQGSAGSLKDPKEQGRFLFDVNVYNVNAGGCRGYGGFVGGGGPLSDPIGPPLVPARPYAPFSTWLSLFAPGLYQAAVAPPAIPLADPVRPLPAVAGDAQSDPAVDPNYPVRRPVPNRVYYDSAGAPPVTPGQLVGGVSTTINGIIQQLTGQVQPVYQTGAYRARSRNQRSSYG
ncbi:uncharacterized protein [Drosophila tropicalis]|uniref:uncharacterized protein n=1 Tax=Drosophila tropicalis TaxID=46794 RepID=UPI0035AB9065